MRALRHDDPDRYALMLLNQALGGGMSSRLFQEVRERRGLAYSVYSYRAALDDAGVLAVSAGTAPDRVDELLDVLDRELRRVVDDAGVSDRELEAARGHLRGSLALSLESSGARMHRLGRNEVTLGDVPSLDEVVARIDAVTPDDVARVVERVFADRAAHPRRRRPVFRATLRRPGVASRRDEGRGVRRRRSHGPHRVRRGRRRADLELVAAVDPYHAGIDLQQLGVADTGLQVAGSADALADAGAEVAVDFTVLDAARGNLVWCADHGVHAVVGTTGFTPDDLEELRRRFDASAGERGDRPQLLDRGGAHDALRRARRPALRHRGDHRAAPRREDRRAVRDRAAHRPAHGRRVTRLGCRPDPAGRRRGGPRRRDDAGIRIHSVRLRGLVAHQEVLLGTTGQTLSIRHDSYDRASFMPGVVLAVRSVADRPGLTVGLDALLGL